MSKSKRASRRSRTTPAQKPAANASRKGSPQDRQKHAQELMVPRLFRALADPNRVALLLQLAGCGGTCTVSEASRCCPVDLSVVSRHLAVLREAGVVEWQRRGREIHYRLRADALVATLRQIADAIESCCAVNGCCGPEPGCATGPGNEPKTC